MAYLLYGQLFVENDISALIREFRIALDKPFHWVYLIVCVLLMPVNWVLEGKKWYLLVNRFQSFSVANAARSILAGLSLAIVTPGRIGEYGGRLLGIETEKRPDAILANFIGSLGQNIINIGFGILMASVFLFLFMDIQIGVFVSMLCASIVVIAIMVLVYFKIEILNGFLGYFERFKWVDKIRLTVADFSKIETHTLWQVIGYSSLRYMVYLMQYVLLVHYFGVTGEWIPAILGVGTIFFLQSNLPLPPMLSVLARGEMAIFLWSVFTDNVIGIIAATFSLWFLNLVIPALIGMIIIGRTRLLS